MGMHQNLFENVLSVGDKFLVPLKGVSFGIPLSPGALRKHKWPSFSGDASLYLPPPTPPTGPQPRVKGPDFMPKISTTTLSSYMLLTLFC